MVTVKVPFKCSCRYLLCHSVATKMSSNSVGSPKMTDSKHRSAALLLSSRLKSCLETNLDWTLFPTGLAEVQYMYSRVFLYMYVHIAR